jgi:hypothetical protein
MILRRGLKRSAFRMKSRTRKLIAAAKKVQLNSSIFHLPSSSLRKAKSAYHTGKNIVKRFLPTKNVYFKYFILASLR